MKAAAFRLDFIDMKFSFTGLGIKAMSLREARRLDRPSPQHRQEIQVKFRVKRQPFFDLTLLT